MIPVKYTKEQTDFIKRTSTSIKDQWYYIPFWFKEVGENTFELYTFDKLPEPLKREIINIRSETP